MGNADPRIVTSIRIDSICRATAVSSERDVALILQLQSLRRTLRRERWLKTGACMVPPSYVGSQSGRGTRDPWLCLVCILTENTFNPTQ
ncbi:hypothetical protein LIA77_00420 [Sarocladium implicatum]|nr:hypothetical protein LIA77_00420 [Sarocladium implicatum]